MDTLFIAILFQIIVLITICYGFIREESFFDLADYVDILSCIFCLTIYGTSLIAGLIASFLHGCWKLLLAQISVPGLITASIYFYYRIYH